MQLLPVSPQQQATYRKKVNGQSSIIIWTDLVDFESPMLYTKIQPKSFLSSEEVDF